jgi:acetyl-CoA carboxylase biotin carboxyl carrier protein
MSGVGSTEDDAVLDGLCANAVRVLQQVPGPLRRLRLRCGEVAVDLEWAAHVTGEVVAPPDPVAEPEPAPDQTHYVRAPMVGTFYRSPRPGDPPFVQEGTVLAMGQQVGIVEAMKLMNAIEADRAGVVTAILVADATPVEYDQPLVAVTPGDEG